MVRDLHPAALERHHKPADQVFLGDLPGARLAAARDGDAERVLLQLAIATRARFVSMTLGTQLRRR
jgi:hypothetical protein